MRIFTGYYRGKRSAEPEAYYGYGRGYGYGGYGRGYGYGGYGRGYYGGYGYGGRYYG